METKTLQVINIDGKDYEIIDVGTPENANRDVDVTGIDWNDLHIDNGEVDTGWCLADKVLQIRPVDHMRGMEVVEKITFSGRDAEVKSIASGRIKLASVEVREGDVVLHLRKKD